MPWRLKTSIIAWRVVEAPAAESLDVEGIDSFESFDEVIWAFSNGQLNQVAGRGGYVQVLVGCAHGHLRLLHSRAQNKDKSKFTG